MLYRLQQAGFRVPDFLVSPADADEALSLLGSPLAVRSSAQVEDGDVASFAGQFRSFLNLSTSKEITEAIRQCRDSARSPSVINYCRHNGIDPDQLHIEVMVQRMVQPELAGVAFTVNPVTGTEEVVIEACEGLADKLLAGQQEPLPNGHPLLERFRSEISSAACQIQRFLGAPQDVEFAIENGILYILQARPTPLMWSF
jgi:pyruvate,water dikinase